MNRASSPTGWVRNPVMKSPDLDPIQASSYDLGYTWNPLTGCLNHDNGLCKGGGFPCYAYKLAKGRLRPLYLGNPNVAGYDEDKLTGRQKIDMLEDPFYPRFWEERLGQLPDKEIGVFPCDMSDLFGIGIPYDWIERILRIIEGRPYIRFYLLTKQPQNLPQFSPFPDNCWVGVTATNADMLFDAINHLDDIQCSKRYVSIEPMLSSCYLIDLDAHLAGTLDWLIIGAQTKPTVYPKIEWVEEIESAARKAGIAIFEKDNLKRLLQRELIQEMPL